MVKSLARRALGFLTRHAEASRALALVVVATLFLFPLAWPRLGGQLSAETYEQMRRWATGISAGYLAYDAVRTWLAKRFLDAEQRLQEMMRKVIEEVDDALFRNQIPLRLTTCRVKVWKVSHLGWKERWQKPHPAPRLMLHTSTPGRFSRVSGVEWRVGKGVIGKAIAENDVLAVDLNDVWKPMKNFKERQWKNAPSEKKFNLTYDEFRRICHNGGPPNSDVAPFVLAVPVYRGAKALGVVALDTPSAGAGAVRDSSADELLLAIGRAAFLTTSA